MGKKDEKIRTESENDIRKTAKDGIRGRKLNNKNWIKRALVLIAIILIIVAIVMLIANRRLNIKQEDVKEYNYFIFSENGKTGVIDKTGNIIIQPDYNYVQIPNPEKPIFVCMYDYDATSQSYKSKVLNDKGTELYKNFKDISAISANNTSNQWAYQTNILTYKNNGKYGILTTTGETVTKPIYDSIETLDYKDGILKISQGGKYGLIKLNGENVIKANYNSISADGYYNDDSKYQYAGYIVSVQENDGYKFGYIDFNGKNVLDCKYNSIKRITSIKNDNTAYLITHDKNGQVGLNKNAQNVIKNQYDDVEYDDTNKVLSIEDNGKYGVYDLYGNMILPIQYDDMNFAGMIITTHKNGKLLVYDANGDIQKDFAYTSVTPTKSDNYRVTIANDKYGVIDNNKKVLIDNKYQYIEYAFDKYFIYTDNQKSGVLDDTGKVVLNNNYNVVQNITGTNVIQAIENSSKSEIYNKSMNKVLEVTNAHVYIKNNYIEIISDNGIDYLDFDGNIKDPSEIYPNNTMFAKKQNGKWGYVDKNGNVIVDFKYDMATNINEYGYGAIKENGKWGVIDSTGKVIKDPTYTLNDDEPSFVGEFYKDSADYEILSYSRAEVEASK